MTDVKNEYGVVGLGRMGDFLAWQALDKGIRVVEHYREPRYRRGPALLAPRVGDTVLVSST
jgi:3-hydroxyisobutyrate dehydrogenase-like beta-hydroxyacid dehydrogenase